MKIIYLIPVFLSCKYLVKDHEERTEMIHSKAIAFTKFDGSKTDFMLIMLYILFELH